MLQFRWNHITITTNQQARDMVKTFRKIQPTVGAWDTETNGLHVILSTPFTFAFGFVDVNEHLGYTYLVDIERQPELARQVIKAWYQLAGSLTKYLGHNVKYDMHMMANYGMPYTKENLSDTMFYIRYGHDALTPKNGGPPLGLKPYAAQYIDPRAKTHEKLLDAEKSSIVKDLNLKLKLRLKSCGAPPAKYNAKSYTIDVIKAMFKDPIVDTSDLPDNVREQYLIWLQNDVPVYLQNKITGLADADMIPYNILNRENLIRYGHMDIVYTLETYYSLAPIVTNRGNDYAIQIEESLIVPLYEMERVGFLADKEYIEECRGNLKAYIKQQRNKLYDLAGQELSIGQHELIKTILNEDFGLNVPSTGAEELSRLRSVLIIEGMDAAAGVIKFIDLVQELRTLEKWYSTYVVRFLKDLQYTDRLYTTINQVGTVSGRVTSDFQQFPKDAITSEDGVELFHPRRMIKVTGGDYHATVYLDYSQIELRVQALYTILVGNPDLNLCRAYMPYKCVDSSGTIFDYHNINHIKCWDGEWFLSEDTNVHWHPTDVHGATTAAATGLDPSDPKFKAFRSTVGKRVNFAKNYGAKRGKIREMFPDKTEEEITLIDEAYYKAFPGIKAYHQYCYDRAAYYSYTTNLFGVRYYGVSGHKLINMLIQGSSAFFLKLKIREIYDYFKKNNIKSRFQMNIHDELSFEKHISEDAMFFEVQEIMQNWEDTIVPIVAEMEVTTTTWADKKGVHNLNELQQYLIA